MTHNQDPARNEQTPGHRGSIVQYTDGNTALVWDVPGDRLDTSFGSQHEWLRGVGQLSSMVIIRTMTGAAYGLGDGVVLSSKSRMGYPARGVIESVAIGEPLTIPGVAMTDEVESLTVDYKFMPPGSGDEQVDRVSPFIQLAEQINFVNGQLAARSSNN